jgi:formylglycine-generating enzyme required for sulfatase activity/uncharacterized caspase-like protein
MGPTAINVLWDRLLRWAALTLIPLVVLAPVAHAASAKRIALIIGNGSYQNAPKLPNPANDARAVAEALRGLDFAVIEATDLDQPDMLARLDEFAGRLEGAEVGLFYYAGHGLQVTGENYLVPIDARLQREAQVRLQTVPLETVLAAMESAVPTRLIFLDACRDNPLAQALKRGMIASRSSAVQQGLAEVRTGVGTLIAYATGPGDVASDGDGPHSPFTSALLDHIATPGLEVRQVLGRVRDEVLKRTRDRQVPWDSSSLRGEFYFRPVDITPVAPHPLPEAPGPAVAAARSSGTFDERQLDLGFWESVRGSDAAEDFEAYLQSFPNGVYAVLARRRLAELLPPFDGAVAEPVPEAPRPEPVTPPAPVPTVAARTPEEPQAPPLGETDATMLAVPAPPTPAEIEATLALSSDDWRSLQRAMTALGFETGGADGKPGPATRKALAAWQQAKRVDPNGYLAPFQRELILSEAQPKLAEFEAAQASIPEPVRPTPAIVAARGGGDRSKAGEVFSDCPACPEMVVIPAGTFTMGSPVGEQRRSPDEGPQHKVTIKRPFALGRYEVTFAQWDACVAAGGCNHHLVQHIWGRGQQPVIHVSWNDANAYATWLSKHTGKVYRLPTEAEWEYAARAGTSTPFWTGGTISTAQANFDGTYSYANGPIGTHRREPVVVNNAAFESNPFGLYHMNGNLQEWVQDCYVSNYEDVAGVGDIIRDRADCPVRVLRGGSFDDVPARLRSAARVIGQRGSRLPVIGFRVAMNLTD